MNKLLKDLTKDIERKLRRQKKNFFEDVKNLHTRMLNDNSFACLSYSYGRYNQLIDDALNYDIITYNTWRTLYIMGSRIEDYCIHRGFER